MIRWALKDRQLLLPISAQYITGTFHTPALTTPAQKSPTLGPFFLKKEAPSVKPLKIAWRRLSGKAKSLLFLWSKGYYGIEYYFSLK